MKCQQHIDSCRGCAVKKLSNLSRPGRLEHFLINKLLISFSVAPLEYLADPWSKRFGVHLLEFIFGIGHSEIQQGTGASFKF